MIHFREPKIAPVKLYYLAFSLSVLPQIVPFSFGDIPVYSGRSTHVTCFISEGDLPLYVNWNFRGRSLYSQEGVTVTKIGKKASLLLIESVTENHSGNYTCTAKNKAGFVHYTATLYVYGISIFNFI